MNRFEKFTIWYKQPITKENYFKTSIYISYRGEEHPLEFNRSYISLVIAELLTSAKLENVKQGIKLYEEATLYWLSQMTKKEYLK